MNRSLSRADYHSLRRIRGRTATSLSRELHDKVHATIRARVGDGELYLILTGQAVRFRNSRHYSMLECYRDVARMCASRVGTSGEQLANINASIRARLSRRRTALAAIPSPKLPRDRRAVRMALVIADDNALRAMRGQPMRGAA